MFHAHHHSWRSILEGVLLLATENDHVEHSWFDSLPSAETKSFHCVWLGAQIYSNARVVIAEVCLSLVIAEALSFQTFALLKVFEQLGRHEDAIKVRARAMLPRLFCIHMRLSQSSAMPKQKNKPT